MRKWKLYSIRPVAPVTYKAQTDAAAEPVAQANPSLLSGVFKWATQSLKWLASLWSRSAAVATTGVPGHSAAHVLQDGAEMDGVQSVQTPSTSQPAAAQQEFSTTSNKVGILIDADSLNNLHAEHAAALRTPSRRISRRVTWSEDTTDAPRPSAEAGIEPAVMISSSGEIEVMSRNPIQRAATWPEGTMSCHGAPRVAPVSAPSLSEPQLAVSTTGQTILTDLEPQLPSTYHASSTKPASLVADFNHTSAGEQLREQHTAKGDKAADSRGKMAEDGLMIAAVHGIQQLQEEEEEAMPLWKVKVDARRARALKRQCASCEFCNCLDVLDSPANACTGGLVLAGNRDRLHFFCCHH